MSINMELMKAAMLTTTMLAHYRGSTLDKLGCERGHVSGEFDMPFLGYYHICFRISLDYALRIGHHCWY